jgi:predicted dehydrogenase
LEKIIHVGLASYGMSGKVFHGPLLKAHSGFRLKKVVERSAEKSKADYPEVEVVRSFEELLADEAIQLVVVNTPNALHYEMAKQALQAGKHVIVEKPFTVTAEEARELIKLAQSKQLILTVFQNRRWDGDFLTVQKVLEQKLVGKLVECEIHYDRFRNFIEANTWKEETGPGSGILYNLGSHLIDQALVLFGTPKSIMADLRTQRPGGSIDDSYHITLHYPDLRVILKSSYLVREAGPRYILHGTEGSFLKWGLDPQEDALKKGGLPGQPDWGTEPASEWGVLNTQVGELHFKGTVETLPGAYQQFYENLYDAITLKVLLSVKPEESLEVIRIIQAAIESNRRKQTVTL